MGKSYVENSLKRFLKRKVKITLGIVVTFLIIGTVGLAEEIIIEPIIIDEINNPPDESGNEKEKLIEITESKDVKFNSSQKINDTDTEFAIHIDNGNKNGYGDNKKFGYVNIDTKGNFIIKSAEDSIVKGGINVNTYAGTIDINAEKGIVIDIKGDTLIGTTESGHINLKAKENIILNAESNNNDIVMGYIGNLNNSYVTEGKENTLGGINGIRESDINIITDGNIIFTANESDQNNYMNVGIFSAGVRKRYDSVVNGGDERNYKYIDKDGYVMSEKNMTTLKGNNIDITIRNKHGIANGILVQNSDKAFVNLNSINSNSLTVISENSDSIGIDTADGNINFSSSNGSNTIKAIVENSKNIGIGVQAENNKDNWDDSDYYNRINIFAEKNNTIFGTSTGISSLGQDTIINIENNNGTNLIESSQVKTQETNSNYDDYAAIVTRTGSKISLVSTNGNNIIKNSSESKEKTAVKIESGGILTLSAGNLNTVVGNIYVTGEKSFMSTETSKNEFVGNILAEDNGKIKADFDGQVSSLTGHISLGNKNDGIVNISINNNGKWNNTANSTVSSLNFNNGIVDMSYTKDNQDLTIKNMSGENGIFVMDISTEDLKHENGKTDFINVEDADKAQTHFIEIGKNSIEELLNYDFDNKNPDKAIWFADTDQNVSFKGKTFSSLANVLDYTPIIETNKRDFSTNGTNWYITGLDKEENEVPQTVIDDLSFLYNAAISRLELDTLHKRMGEIRNYENTQGIWFRTSAGELKSDVSDSSFENDYYMLQVGYDKKKVSEKGNWFTGFAVSRRQNDIDFRNGDGESENIGLSLYRSFAGKNNTYFDLIGKYTYLDTEYKVHNSNSEMKADYDTWAGTLSAEFGKKYSSKNDKWYITPHAQLNYTYVNGEDYTTSTGVKVEQDNIDSLIGRIGVYAGKDFEKSSHYLKVSVLNEFMGDYGAVIKGADTSLTKKIDGDDTWTEVGIGGNFQVGNSGTTHIYYDVEKTFGSRFETQWQGTLGFRISFDKINDLFTAPAKPLTKNKTKEGRTTNRKVEVNYN